MLNRSDSLYIGAEEVYDCRQAPPEVFRIPHSR